MTKKIEVRTGDLDVQYESIFGDVAEIIESARRSAARSVNSIMTAAYWLIGRRIVEFEQSGKKRAEYGTALIERLAVDMSKQFGRGFSRQNIQQMRLFYLLYPAERIFQTPSGESVVAGQASIYQTVSGKSQTVSAEFSLAGIASKFPLPWSAYVRLLSVKDENAPVELILCARKDEAVARYALEGLPNKVMAAEYRTALPDEKTLAAEIRRTQAMLEERKLIALSSLKDSS